MVPCPACKIFHHPMLNCKVAENQLWSGTLAEPWLSANRKALESAPVKPDAGLVTASKKVVKGVGGRPRVYADPEARRKERQRVYMKKWRAKK